MIVRETALILCMALSIVATGAVPHQAQAEPRPRPLVLTVAGVTAGSATRDSQVVKMFGEGCFVEEEGHGGGRYFLSPGRSVTLHTVIGVDGATEMVELSGFVDLPKGCAHSAEAATANLPEQPAVDCDIRFRMAPEQVMEFLGRPNADETEGSARTLKYRSTRNEDPRVDLYYEAEFRFVGHLLTRISIYHGE